jgi:hypothetical protein
LYEWSDQYIVKGELKDWKKAAMGLGLPPQGADATLWLDSTDVPLEKKSNTEVGKEER